MTPDTDVTPVAAGSITLWDHEADVVIAGDDVAGAAAAVEAARSVASGVSLGDGSYGRRAGRAAAKG
jgi:3-oxo-5alpha-steroid 4-dehydrogenase